MLKAEDDRLGLGDRVQGAVGEPAFGEDPEGDREADVAAIGPRHLRSAGGRLSAPIATEEPRPC
jgi:hypothetical protein